jgi:membrane-associated phospholipid phosphatase
LTVFSLANFSSTTGVFPSGHVVAAGALTFLYPSIVPYTLTLILSRLLMGYHTALQCLFSYIIGMNLLI